MNLRDLIDELTNLAEIHDYNDKKPEYSGQNINVSLAFQPNYPFEHSIGQLVVVNNTLYISEDDQIDYLPEEVKEELGW